MPPPVDLGAIREAIAGPGVDTRQWVSFGVVEAKSDETPDQAVEFTPEFGPLVSVVLQPSGMSVRCRVSSSVAGNMEGEYYPFVTGDEVIVVIPEGDERAGCTIIGRLNNELDLWPGGIAGQDATLNNLAFKRTRAPFIHEFADSYQLRSVTSSAFMTISRDGQIMLSNADRAFLSLTPDFVGMQSGDAQQIIQLDLGSGNIVLQAGAVLPIPFTTTFTLGDNSTFFSRGGLTLSAAGQVGMEHAASAEGVANMIFNILQVMWASLLPAISGATLIVNPSGLVVGTTPVTGVASVPVAPLAAAMTPLVNPAGLIAAMNAGLEAAAPFNITPFAAAIAAALAAKVPGDLTGTLPSIGSLGILIA